VIEGQMHGYGMEPQMSDTPRTDLVVQVRGDEHAGEAYQLVPATFARQLEREVDHLRSELRVAAERLEARGHKMGAREARAAMEGKLHGL
jgi:hypothetical protein